MDKYHNTDFNFLGGRVNYWVILLKIFIVIFFSAVVIVALVSLFYIFDYKLNIIDLMIRLFGIFTIVISGLIIGLRNLSSLFIQKYSLIFNNQKVSLSLRNIYSFKEARVLHEDIMGFSTTHIATDFKKFHGMILYLKDGSVFEFHKTLFPNFDEMKKRLANDKIKYLGHEPFVYKWFFFRKYLFLEKL